jgi:periplasmic divalent cation tolerance protein
MAAVIDPEVVLALTTEAGSDLAQALARELLELGLVACVSLQPVGSLYIWQGRLEQSQEVQLLLKTDGSRLPALAAAVHRLHSYDTPQWLTWPARASSGYGAWLQGALSPDAAAAAPADRSAGADPAG